MKEANFDHVDSQGQLVLSLDGQQVVLPLTDELERGILSAKQILSESSLTAGPAESSALPISSIQALVRQGQSTAEVAAHYAIAESLVRRFAQSVETEKRYAIAQFLAVRTQTGQATRSLEELIDHHLREGGVDPVQVDWQATRQNHEPWKIVARFANQAHEGKATWMWNMKDHSVVSIDPTAKRLLGENASADSLLFGEDTATTSRHSIQAALDGRGPVPPAWLNDDATEAAADTPAAVEPGADSPAADAQADNQLAGPSTVGRGKANETEPTSAATTGQTDLFGQTIATKAAAESEPDDPVAGTAKESGSSNDEPEPKGTEKKKRRSTIPSWDDILFGD